MTIFTSLLATSQDERRVGVKAEHDLHEDEINAFEPDERFCLPVRRVRRLARVHERL